jgi:hypothetical protein
MGKLFGLNGEENTNRKPNEYWGKNQFNSSFPAALCLWMESNHSTFVYATYSNGEHFLNEQTFDVLWGQAGESSHFLFEDSFTPYSRYTISPPGRVDLVTKNVLGQYSRALEVKLTVIPDNTTCDLPEDEWGFELVIRPNSIKHAILGLYNSTEGNTKVMDVIREATSQLCLTINWNSASDVQRRFGEIHDAAKKIREVLTPFQSPLILNAIWKTLGQSPIIAKDAFDVFVWSNLALCSIAIDQSVGRLERQALTRQQRTVARFVRSFNELCTQRRANLESIFTEMAYELQTDKEFALSGRDTHQIFRHERLRRPSVGVDALRQIILDDGQKELRPERRLDASIFFATLSG